VVQDAPVDPTILQALEALPLDTYRKVIRHNNIDMPGQMQHYQLEQERNTQRCDLFCATQHC